MRWNKLLRSGGLQQFVRRFVRNTPRPVWSRALLICVPILLAAILLLAAPSDKHLSVYSTAANYSLPIVQRDRRDYVGLLEVLEPLGKVSAKFDGQRWRLRYNSRVEGDFFVGRTRVRVQGNDI